MVVIVLVAMVVVVLAAMYVAKLVAKLVATLVARLQKHSSIKVEQRRRTSRDCWMRSFNKEFQSDRGKKNA